MKYLFYPFDDGTGIDTLEQLIPGAGGDPGRAPVASPKIGELYRNDGTYPAGLWRVGLNDEVFVIGHAAEGLKVLGDAKKNLIDQTEVVKRLEACGLRKDAACKIVMYACESGKGGKESLAAKVASALKTNKFVCANNVWGFMHKVSMKAHNGALCVWYGKNWIDYQGLEYVLMKIPPNH